jgi:hypothetical protein
MEEMWEIWASPTPNSEVLFRTGWMWREESKGLPVSWPRRWLKVFWRALLRLCWERKKTTPRWETWERVLAHWFKVSRAGNGYL